MLAGLHVVINGAIRFKANSSCSRTFKNGSAPTHEQHRNLLYKEHDSCKLARPKMEA